MKRYCDTNGSDTWSKLDICRYLGIEEQFNVLYLNLVGCVLKIFITFIWKISF